MKFEYLTIQLGGMPMKQTDLNELGSEGWGLVAVGFDTAYLMREKVEKKETANKAAESKTETVGSGPFVNGPKSETTTALHGVKHNPKPVVGAKK